MCTVLMTCVLSCMSVFGGNVENWWSCVVNDGSGLMLDSFMRVVCDKKLVVNANEADLTMENGCKPKAFKKVATCCFYKDF